MIELIKEKSKESKWNSKGYILSLKFCHVLSKEEFRVVLLLDKFKIFSRQRMKALTPR